MRKKLAGAFLASVMIVTTVLPGYAQEESILEGDIVVSEEADVSEEDVATEKSDVYDETVAAEEIPEIEESPEIEEVTGTTYYAKDYFTFWEAIDNTNKGGDYVSRGYFVSTAGDPMPDGKYKVPALIRLDGSEELYRENKVVCIGKQRDSSVPDTAEFIEKEIYVILDMKSGVGTLSLSDGTSTVNFWDFVYGCTGYDLKYLYTGTKVTACIRRDSTAPQYTVTESGDKVYYPPQYGEFTITKVSNGNLLCESNAYYNLTELVNVTFSRNSGYEFEGSSGLRRNAMIDSLTIPADKLAAHEFPWTNTVYSFATGNVVASDTFEKSDLVTESSLDTYYFSNTIRNSVTYGYPYYYIFTDKKGKIIAGGGGYISSKNTTKRDGSQTPAFTGKIKLSKARVSFAADGEVYNGKAYTPGCLVSYKGTVFGNDVDYVVQYYYKGKLITPSEIVNAGTYTAVIKATPGSTVCKGSVKKKFRIKPARVADGTTVNVNTEVNWGDPVIYSPASCKPFVEVTYKGMAMTAGEDYKVSYAYNKAVTEATTRNKPVIKIKGKGNYTGTAKVNFEILPYTFSDSDWTVIKDDGYLEVVNSADISKLKLKPVLTIDQKKLKLNRDYTLEYYTDYGLTTSLDSVAGVEDGKDIYFKIIG